MAGENYPRKRGRPPEDGERVSVFRNVAMCRLSGSHILDRDERRRVYQTRTAECKRENVPFVKNLFFCQNRLQALKNAPRNAPSLRVVDAPSNSRRTRHAPFLTRIRPCWTFRRHPKRGNAVAVAFFAPNQSGALDRGRRSSDVHGRASPAPSSLSPAAERPPRATPHPVSIAPSPVELLGSMRFRSTAGWRGGRGWRVMGNSGGSAGTGARDIRGGPRFESWPKSTTPPDGGMGSQEGWPPAKSHDTPNPPAKIPKREFRSFAGRVLPQANVRNAERPFHKPEKTTPTPLAMAAHKVLGTGEGVGAFRSFASRADVRVIRGRSRRCR